MAAFWKKLFQKEKKKKEVKAKKATSKSQEAKIKVEEKKEEIKILKPKSKTGFANKILIKPLITEKAAQVGALRQYTFEVWPQANKAEIKQAIKDLYGEKPVSVKTINMLGKQVRYGRTLGKRKNWKKAIIIFRPGIKLEVFEGV